MDGHRLLCLGVLRVEAGSDAHFCPYPKATVRPPYLVPGSGVHAAIGQRVQPGFLSLDAGASIVETSEPPSIRAVLDRNLIG